MRSNWVKKTIEYFSVLVILNTGIIADDFRFTQYVISKPATGIFENSNGQKEATVSRQSTKLVHRSINGQVLGTATKSGSMVTYRNASGQVKWTATTGRITTYRTPTGSITGTSTESGNKAIFRNQTGQIKGSASRESFSTIVNREPTGKKLGQLRLR